jgi:hypothetical protein
MWGMACPAVSIVVVEARRQGKPYPTFLSMPSDENSRVDLLIHNNRNPFPF